MLVEGWPEFPQVAGSKCWVIGSACNCRCCLTYLKHWNIFWRMKKCTVLIQKPRSYDTQKQCAATTSSVFAVARPESFSNRVKDWPRVIGWLSCAVGNVNNVLIEPFLAFHVLTFYCCFHSFHLPKQTCSCFLKPKLHYSVPTYQKIAKLLPLQFSLSQSTLEKWRSRQKICTFIVHLHKPETGPQGNMHC